MKKTLILIGALLTLTSCQALQQIAAELSAQSDSISSASYSSSSGSSAVESNFSSSSSDEDTTIAYRVAKENKDFAFSRLNQKHIHYINIPDTEDYVMRNGRIEFKTYEYNQKARLKYNIKGIFFNKSEFKYYLEVLLNGYLPDGSSYVKHKLLFELAPENRHDIDTKNYNDYLMENIFSSDNWSSDLKRAFANINLDGNKVIFPINAAYKDGVIIKLYKGDKLVYSSNQRTPKKSEAK